MRGKLWINIRMFLWMTFLTGIIYPLLITTVAQLTMKQRADGDFLVEKGKVIGSKLIAQKFESDQYFWGRPSAVDYNPLPSGASNLGPTSLALKTLVEERQNKILKSHQVDKGEIPPELLFASGSGLDPHIHVSTAYFQMERVARSRGVQIKDVKDLIDKMLIKKKLGFLGENCVNVLLLNRALDEQFITNVL